VGKIFNIQSSFKNFDSLMGQNSETTGAKLKSVVWEMGEHFLQDSEGAFFETHITNIKARGQRHLREFPVFKKYLTANR